MRARTILLGLAMGALAANSMDAGELMTIRVSPAVCFAPANLVVQARILSHAENRSIQIVAESDDFYRSSELQLDGDRAPRTTRFEFRSLPPGTYEVKATLRDESGHERAAVRQQVNVITTGAR